MGVQCGLILFLWLVVVASNAPGDNHVWPPLTRGVQARGGRALAQASRSREERTPKPHAVWQEVMAQSFPQADSQLRYAGPTAAYHWSPNAKGLPGIATAMRNLKAGETVPIALVCGGNVVGGCSWMAPLKTALEKLYKQVQVVVIQPEEHASSEAELLHTPAAELDQLAELVREMFVLESFGAFGRGKSELIEWFPLAVIQVGGFPCGAWDGQCKKRFDWEGYEGTDALKMLQAYERLIYAFANGRLDRDEVWEPTVVAVSGVSQEEEFASNLRARVNTVHNAATISLHHIHHELGYPISSVRPLAQGEVLFTAILHRLASAGEVSDAEGCTYAAAVREFNHGRLNGLPPAVCARGGEGLGAVPCPRAVRRREEALPARPPARPRCPPPPPRPPPQPPHSSAGEGPKERRAGGGAAEAREAAWARAMRSSQELLAGPDADAAARRTLLKVLRRHALDTRGRRQQRGLLAKLASGRPLRIAIFGGSVPAGHHLPPCATEEALRAYTGAHGGANLIRGGPLAVNITDRNHFLTAAMLGRPAEYVQLESFDKCTYAVRLAALLLEHFPHANHSVVNFAQGGFVVGDALAEVEQGLDQWEAAVPPAPGQPALDLALLDFAMNEANEMYYRQLAQQEEESEMWEFNAAEVRVLREDLEAHEALLRVLRRRSHGAAAVVAVEWTDVKHYGTYFDFLEPLLSAYQVATVSLEDFWEALPAAAPPPGGPDPALADQAVLRALGLEETEQDGKGDALAHFVTWRMHQLMANLVLMYLLRRNDVEYSAAERAAGPPAPLFCDGMCRGEVRPVQLQNAFLAWGDATLVKPPGGKVPAGWRHGVDKGIIEAWISNNTAVSSEPLTFPIRYHSGRVEVTFLRSYENIGDLRVWIDDVENVTAYNCKELIGGFPGVMPLAGPVVLSGLWESRFSVPSRQVVAESLPHCAEEKPRLPLEDVPRGCESMLHICPVINAQTGSAKVKLSLVLTE